MLNIGTSIATNLRSLLTAPTGTDFQLNALAQSLSAVPPVPLNSVSIGNASGDFLEQSLPLRYPTVNVFCEKLENTLKERFRTFSGKARMVIEIRHSQDQIQNIQQSVENYATAACQVLDGSRGDWGNGLFYGGGYEVQFTPVKKGGRNFVQTAKILLDVDVSI
jgi:hypothetical protein